MFTMGVAPILIASFLLGSASCEKHVNLENRVSSIDQKVDVLDTRVDRLFMDRIESAISVLDQRVDDLTDRVDKLSGVNPRPGSSSGSPGGGNGIGGSVSERAGVTPLEVRAEAVEDQLKMTVRYYKIGGNITAMWRYSESWNKSPIESKNEAISDHVYETSALVTPSNDSRVYVTIRDVDHMFSSTIKLMPFIEEQTAVADVEDPLLEIESDGDIVYEEGKDVIFKMKIANEMAGDHIGPSYHDWDVTASVVDLRSLEFTYLHFSQYSYTNMYEIVERSPSTDYTELTIKIKTSEYRVSGVLHFNVHRDGNRSSFIVGIHDTKSVILRPSSQEGPFPPGYLTFARDQDTNKDGDMEKHCSLRDGCSIMCSAIGEDIEEISMYRVDADGKETKMDQPDIMKLTTEYFAVVNTDLKTDIKDQQYKCQAYNSHGTVVTQTIQVSTFVDSEILRNESKVVVLPSLDENSTERIVLLKCMVKGKPHPSVTFTVEQRRNYEYGVPPDEVSVISDRLLQATKTVTFDTSDPYGWETNTGGLLTSASCVAQMGELTMQYSNDYYMFEIPEDLDQLQTE